MKNKYLSASGLIMGSMVPDFEFFIRMKAEGPYGHTFLGMLWLNIPLAMVFLFLYHNVVRNELIYSLPLFFEKRFNDFLTFNWNRYFGKNFLIVIVSILLGNMSHLLWDSFTHFDGFFVERIPFLQREILGIPIYDASQYICSLIGLIAILFFVFKMPIDTEIESKKGKINYWLYVVLVTAAVMFLRFRNESPIFFGDGIVSLLFAFMVGLFLASLTKVYKYKKA
ncbi:hypothetical protein GGR42_002156 [Saonia flava]|uniref:DUF4184 family protein n=1 Tax=Saonia flava TaxID=523696 RepID=A0A846R2V3_9FLAO|nr:hypothetical protein [Saonia flava]